MSENTSLLGGGGVGVGGVAGPPPMVQQQYTGYDPNYAQQQAPLPPPPPQQYGGYDPNYYGGYQQPPSMYPPEAYVPPPTIAIIQSVELGDR